MVAQVVLLEFLPTSTTKARVKRFPGLTAYCSLERHNFFYPQILNWGIMEDRCVDLLLVVWQSSNLTTSPLDRNLSEGHICLSIWLLLGGIFPICCTTSNIEQYYVVLYGVTHFTCTSGIFIYVLVINAFNEIVHVWFHIWVCPN